MMDIPMLFWLMPPLAIDSGWLHLNDYRQFSDCVVKQKKDILSALTLFSVATSNVSFTE